VRSIRGIISVPSVGWKLRKKEERTVSVEKLGANPERSIATRKRVSKTKP